ncbi:MAG: PLP-dependent aminotransferase family protein [Clostridiaceae bacterium]|nr:PLP-dependent aminotransferase family protein [Clostridiaceae bacterium]MBW4860256.1 PLP-dependent aminotransferase family protein [Clostridiaceae bacterium]MBW4869233.1 PLP-dependent aminotransferase family protein [Clostridiaceae bacterium]
MKNNIIIQLDKNLNKSLYIQLADKLKKLIEDGVFQKDEKLPSIRSLAKKLEVNNITIVNAYKLLEQEGYVYSKKGSGTYVKRQDEDLSLNYLADQNMELMTSGILSLSKNSINFASVSPTPELFPVEEFKQVLIEVLDRDKGKAFVYPEINGYGPLRESISYFLKDNYYIDIEASKIQIISGGQQGIDLLAKTLIQPGDYVFVENPTYSGAVAAFESRDAKIIGIPMEHDGINLDTLKKHIDRYHPKFLYTMPNYQSPTTYSYSEEKKKELLELAHKNDLYIIEDDFMSDLSYRDKKLPLKSMDKYDQVIYIKSFSKILMPGLRLGFLTTPEKFFKDIIKAKHTTDISSSGFIQRAFDLFLRENFWKQHIERVKKDYNEKYKLILKKINNFKKYNINFKRPDGGLSLWLELPNDISCIELYNECANNNVIIVPGEIFFIDSHSSKTNFIRLSFGSVNKKQIVEGINVIENCIAKLKGGNDDNTKFIPLI